jgi:hypothetical protein
MKAFFREWGRRLDARMSMFVIIVALLNLFVMLRDGFDHSKPGLWFLFFASILLPALLFKRAWRLNFSWDDDPPPAPLTSAQLRQQRILAVADTVDGLPDGMTLGHLCEKLDEKQLRRLLHQLNQIRPGNRHLRDVVQQFVG